MTGALPLSADALRTLMLPRDRSGFVRRQCAHCRRHFKTRPAAQDGLAVQRWLSRGVPHGEADRPAELDHSRCPYCGQSGAAEDWLTMDQRCRIDRVAQKLRGHLTYAQLLQGSFGEGWATRPTFVPVAPEPLPSSLGSEPEDLRPLLLVCCDVELKVQADWDGALHCPSCGALHGRPSARRQMHLTFIEE